MDRCYNVDVNGIQFRLCPILLATEMASRGDETNARDDESDVVRIEERWRGVSLPCSQLVSSSICRCWHLMAQWGSIRWQDGKLV